MEIEVQGNIEYYNSIRMPLEQSMDIISLKIVGTFGIDYHLFPYGIHLNDVLLGKLNWYDLVATAKSIRGCLYKDVIAILNEKGINYKNLSSSYQEIGLIKALFNIFIWIESDLTTSSNMLLEPYIFDEFILDYNGNVGAQEDIYFIPRSQIVELRKQPILLSILIKLNLICSVSITYSNGRNMNSYFIPFSKPGLKLNSFFNADPNYGQKAYDFYKSLLGFRDSKIKNFIAKK